MESTDIASSIPSWLNLDLFDKAIQSYESDAQAKVTNFDIKSATQPGENFASAVFRAIVKYTSKHQQDEKELSVIIKTQPFNVDQLGSGMDHMKDTTLFKNEIAAYTEVLMKIQELISSVGYEDIMCPKLIYQTMTPKPVIMLEDVKAIGYDTLITTAHDDFEVSKMIFKRLAKFHAASFYLEDEKVCMERPRDSKQSWEWFISVMLAVSTEPQLKYCTLCFVAVFVIKIDAAAFDFTIFSMDSVVAIFTANFDIFLNYISEWEGYEEFIEPIKNFRTVYAEKCQKSTKPNTGAGAFNVLNHGDFHLKNVLYKINKEDGKIEDFVALDYQICVYGSPAIDFAYAFFNFTSDNNRFDRYDEILFIYHKQFVEALKKFGYLKQPPSLLDLQIEILKNGHLQATNFMHMFPLSIMDLNDFKDDEMEPGFSGMMKKAYKNENYKKILKRNLKRFLNNGFFG
ncbi:unnamed protein product [Chironomus riparius]|uniref:CHK kinase-like domain-containing protein n=1 Tax=Chironomus riparius TaxID=315576 RepID=A0A9N9S6I4_9DIPT|nr:unnamed protein product [Chironomus riparius]